MGRYILYACRRKACQLVVYGERIKMRLYWNARAMGSTTAIFRSNATLLTASLVSE